jgi:hypothetical protein
MSEATIGRCVRVACMLFFGIFFGRFAIAGLGGAIVILLVFFIFCMLWAILSDSPPTKKEDEPPPRQPRRIQHPRSLPPGTNFYYHNPRNGSNGRSNNRDNN